MGDVFHFIVVVQDVDAGIHQSQVGGELHIAGIQHVGQQRHLVFIAVLGDVVILVRQPYAVLLCPQVGKGGQEVHIPFLHGIFHLFLHQLVSFLRLTHIQSRLFQRPVVLEQGGKVVFYAYAYIPIIEIVIQYGYFNGNGAVQIRWKCAGVVSNAPVSLFAYSARWSLALVSERCCWLPPYSANHLP